MTEREKNLKADLIEDYEIYLDDFKTADSLEMIAYELDSVARSARHYIAEIRRIIGEETFDKRVKLFPVKD